MYFLMPPCLEQEELIDTLWNVNPRGYYTFLDGITELIDTLWNVNWTYQDDKGQWHIELIDTLWNVNIFLQE